MVVAAVANKRPIRGYTEISPGGKVPVSTLLPPPCKDFFKLVLKTLNATPSLFQKQWCIKSRER